MLLKTILNHRYPLKGFVYGNCKIVTNDSSGLDEIHVEVAPRKNSKPRCGQCGKLGSTYDTRKPRRFQFVPMFGLQVFFLYAMRRVNCKHCGSVKTEQLSWARCKEQMTGAYKWFLATWARRMNWSEVAKVFGTSWNRVYRSVGHAVKWGLANRETPKFTAIGVDEIAYKRGHKYLTLVYQIDSEMRRLLWIGKDRKEKTFDRFFDQFEQSVKSQLKFICSDMWKPYLKVIASRAGHVVHVLDRFHIMQTMNKKVDKVRAEETRQLKADGYEPILKHSRWCLLKRRENHTENQRVKLSELMKYNLRTMRAYLLKEDFQQFWTYRSPAWAGKFLDTWCTGAMRSQLKPMKEMAGTLRRHRELLLNWFRAKGEISSASVEGMNTKAKSRIEKIVRFQDL